MPRTVADSEPFRNRSVGHALHIRRGHTFDALQRFVQAELAIEVDLLPGQVRHAARRVLEAQHEAALQVILRALELGDRHRRLFHAAQFFDDEVDHLADRVVRAAGVDGERSGVAIRAQSAEHRVGEAALLTHVLKQTRAHRPAEKRIQQVARIPIVVVLRIAAHTDAEVALFELLVADQHLGHHLGGLLTQCRAVGRQRPELLVHELADPLVFQVADGRHDQIAGGVRLLEVVAQTPPR